jgi:hypothetical protein
MPVLSADAVLRRSQEGEFTADAWVPGVGTSAFTADSTFRAVIGQEFIANSVTRAEGSGTITASSVISAETEHAFTADAVTYKSSSGDLTANAVVVPMDAAWNDLGAWDAVWQVGNKDAQGNVTSGDALLVNAKNSLVHASSRLVSAVGVENLIIIETADAVLVANRKDSQDVKSIVKQWIKRQKAI